MNTLLAILCLVLIFVIIDVAFKIEDVKDEHARASLRKNLYCAMRINWAKKRGLA